MERVSFWAGEVRARCARCAASPGYAVNQLSSAEPEEERGEVSSTASSPSHDRCNMESSSGGVEEFTRVHNVQQSIKQSSSSLSLPVTRLRRRSPRTAQRAQRLLGVPVPVPPPGPLAQCGRGEEIFTVPTGNSLSSASRSIDVGKTGTLQVGWSVMVQRFHVTLSGSGPSRGTPNLTTPGKGIISAVEQVWFVTVSPGCENQKQNDPNVLMVLGLGLGSSWACHVLGPHHFGGDRPHASE
ncbi:hypothetical protein SKAU_G00003720 [Synaphobranchus kaupii]|uniref:Uncharacterized protein n=1 Tax=Synaphobranchus kaupii TaxID=118154 RepID=A0A9Q1G8Q0_SYNKA|nr:hypothetical protein SKAU_G00003720 [Synaphobranchus kaupii]